MVPYQSPLIFKQDTHLSCIDFIHFKEYTVSDTISTIYFQMAEMMKEGVILESDNHFTWLEKITDLSVFDPNSDPFFTHIKKVSHSDKIDSGRILSPVEQLYLAPYYNLNLAGMSHTFTHVDEYAFNRLKSCLALFNKVKYLYDKDILKFITISNPKKQALELFDKHVHTKRISHFVRSLFLDPHDKFSLIATEELYLEKHRAKMDKITFSLNANYVEKVDLKQIDQDFLDFFIYGNPDGFGVEPHKLLLDENLLNNDAVRLLTTIYQNVFITVDRTNNRIIYIMGRKINN